MDCRQRHENDLQDQVGSEAMTKYAVLISGDLAETGYDEFWNDVVILRETLIDNGFAPSDIFVLYGNGSDFFDLARPNPRYRPSPPITNFAATIANVNMVFNGLTNGDIANGIPKMTSEDFLFVWTFNHGGQVGGNATLGLMDGSMMDTNFASLVNQIPHSRRVFCMQQCHSGGFINDLSNPHTVILTACTLNELASRADDSPTQENEVVGGVTYHHGEFNYYLFSALHWKTPIDAPVNADANGNCAVSMLEAFNWVDTNDSRPETPQYDAPCNLGDFLHIACKTPGVGVDVFARDRNDDHGSVPSNLHGEPFWTSPDILVDSDLDGNPDPNPEFGQENYVWVRVHSINLLAACAVVVNLYWGDPTGGLQWPSSFHLIGTKTIHNLQPGQSADTPHSPSDHLSWFPPSPVVNSHYCLLARLDCIDDPIEHPAENDIPGDNNIAMRNVTVIDNYSGVLPPLELFVQNPFAEKEALVDLIISGVPENWTLEARIEKLEKPFKLEGGAREGRISLRLGPGDKRKTKILLVPKKTRLGERATIHVAQAIKGKTVGGYTYRVKIQRVTAIAEAPEPV